MDRVKIQEIAQESGTSNALLIEKAKELGLDAKAANSTLTVEEAGILVDYVVNGIKPKSKIKRKKVGITVVKKATNIENIKYWLIPNNPEEFDAIEELKKGKVWWSNKLNNMKINDIVYIYITKPIQRISIKTKIVDIDNEKKIFCIELIDFLDNDKLSYENLVKKGITNIQGKREIKGSQLIYIQENEKEIKNINKCNLIDEKQKFSNKEIKYNFPYKNILLKGVTGTGKSRIIDKLIDKDLNLKNYKSTNVLKINIHSASSNSDLMQGIAINSNENGNIEYKEKKGLVLEFIEKATFNPNQPFVLVLEEIQENSLNELIGDLIYLIEEDKRAKGYKANNQNYLYSELIDEIITQNKDIASVKLPNLISKQEKTKQMIIPHNLFIFCTSNYRDDRKVIEDNLLRRFEVIEVYPKYKDEIGDDFKNEEVSKFLKELNESIIRVCSDNGEIHPDRFMIGHSIWLKVEDKKAFSRAFLKVITEFKDIKDIHFDDFKNITDKLDFPFGLDKVYSGYEEWIKALQKECYNFLSDK